MSKSLQDSVKEFVEDLMIEQDIDQDSRIDSVDELIDPVINAIRELVETYTTYKYEFNLAMGFFVQMAHEMIKDALEKILDGADFKDAKNIDVYFVCFYALSMIYKKSKNGEALQGLSDSKYRRAFRKYPLYHEVLSRCYKRENQLKNALDEDECAIDKLGEDENNAGPRISYASTVCEMLKAGHPDLEDKHIRNARQYVDEAIKCNEKYQKYPFVKAQLIFLSQYRKGGDPALLIAAREIATELIELAKRLENRTFDNPNYSVDYDKFKRDMAEIIDGLRFPVTYADLEQLKSKILGAKSHKHCSAEDNLPPNPILKDGDKYFFICYSSLDFQSVYCDLIELYKRKVHYRYDRRLENDVNWEEQVKEKINDPDCVGVVFYISGSILNGSAVHKEIQIVMDSGKKRFRLNLESKEPSRILIDYILKRREEHPNDYYIDGDKMRLFLNCFNDNGVFADKLAENGAAATTHMDSYVDSLKGSFTTDIIGE